MKKRFLEPHIARMGLKRRITLKTPSMLGPPFIIA